MPKSNYENKLASRGKSSYEENYQDLLLHVQTEGKPTATRAGGTTRVLNQVLTANLQEGFPLLTGRKLPWAGIVGELCAFLQGATDLQTFKDFGCNFWDANQKASANKPGDLGPIYGAQWRNWQKSWHAGTDQIYQLVNSLKNNSESRRHMVTAWQPADVDAMALPPCHFAFQCHTELVPPGSRLPAPFAQSHILHTTVYMRSADMLLGVPCDMASYALLTHLLAKATNMVPGTVTLFMADCHIYDEHREALSDYLEQPTHELPTLCLWDGLISDNYLQQVVPSQIQLNDYQWSKAIKVPMMV
jgi:thymidylate synthase